MPPDLPAVTSANDGASAPSWSETPAVAPVAPHERIAAIDVLRGAALLGILLLNITSFGLPWKAYIDPTIAGGATGANRVAWFVNWVFFEGKERTIFSMLFGAGVLLLTARAEKRGGEGRVADIYYRRTLWLIVFGLLHAYFLWNGDILYSYGLAGLMLYPFRKLSAKWLVPAGLLLLAVLPCKSILGVREMESARSSAADADTAVAAGRTLTPEQIAAQQGWAEQLKHWKPSAEDVAKEVEAHRASYWTLFLRRMSEVKRWQSSVFYDYIFFDVTGMMLLGMGLFKLGILTAARSNRFYMCQLIVAYGIGVPLNAYVGYRMIANDFDPITQLAVGFSYSDLGRLAVALGHIAVVMLVCKAGVLAWLTKRIAAVGRMPLSNYLLQSVLCTLFFDGYGLEYFDRLERYQLLAVVLTVWAIELAWSPIWLRFFRFGPLEWLWRCLSYWQIQPMRLRPPMSAKAAPASQGANG